MLKFCFFAFFMSYVLYGIEGTYIGSGTDPYEKDTYTVTATFTKDNEVYQAIWNEEQNGTKARYKGTGLKQNGVISFVYQNVDDDSDTGLQIYKIKGDTLEGKFVTINKNLIGEEKISRLKR